MARARYAALALVLAVALQLQACASRPAAFQWTEFRFTDRIDRVVNVPTGWTARWPNRALEGPVALMPAGVSVPTVWASNLAADWASDADVRRRLRGLATRTVRAWSSVTLDAAGESVRCEVTREPPWAAACGSRPKRAGEAGTAAHVEGLSAEQWRAVRGVRMLAEIAARSGLFEEP